MNKVIDLIFVLFVFGIVTLFLYEAYCRRCNVCEIYGKVYTLSEGCVRLEGANNE